MDFYHKKENIEMYRDLIKDYDPSDFINKMMKYIDDGDSLLELGAGFGLDASYLLEHSTISVSLSLSDNSVHFLDFLKKEFPELPVLNIDIKNIVSDTKFDFIFSNKVLMHLTEDELKSSIDAQCKVLKENAKIYHSFWKGEGSFEQHGVFSQYYKLEEIEELFSKQFEILVLEEYAEMEPNDSILIIAKKR